MTGLVLAFGFSAPWIPLLYSFGFGMIGMLIGVIPVTFAQPWKKPFRNTETNPKSENTPVKSDNPVKNSLGDVNDPALVTPTGQNEDHDDAKDDDEQQALSKSEHPSAVVMESIPKAVQPKPANTPIVPT